MTLIKSISGIRGTIGGHPGENLSPVDIVAYVSAFAQMLKSRDQRPLVVVGRDGRISGSAIQQIVMNTLLLSGVDCIDIGLSTTPTVEMEVLAKEANGGIIITASHNDMTYNALKFFNKKGECINDVAGKHLLALADRQDFDYATIEDLGQLTRVSDALDRHILQILQLPLVNTSSIKQRKFRFVADCINSTGALIIPILADYLGCDCILINDRISGSFAHNPEPLAKNLKELSKAVADHKADFGVAVDPDVDRLAFVDERGIYCGEEYTLVMVADYVLSKTPGPTVSNLSSTKALRDITERRGQKYFASAVGEVNVVTKIHDKNAVIGGEGNGGIIYPALHSGRDALVGIALLLSALAEEQTSLSAYRARFPNYHMIKDKIDIAKEKIPSLLSEIAQYFQDKEVDVQDGVKIYIDDGWAHLRKSNTEPIVRLYVEGTDQQDAHRILSEIKKVIADIIPK